MLSSVVLLKLALYTLGMCVCHVPGVHRESLGIVLVADFKVNFDGCELLHDLLAIYRYI